MTKESQRTEEKKFTPRKENKPQTKLKDKEHIWGNMYNIHGWERCPVPQTDGFLSKRLMSQNSKVTRTQTSLPLPNWQCFVLFCFANT